MPLPIPNQLSDGTLAAALKRVPAVPLEQIPEEPRLLDVIVQDFRDGTGHDLDLDSLLA